MNLFRKFFWRVLIVGLLAVCTLGQVGGAAPGGKESAAMDWSSMQPGGSVKVLPVAMHGVNGDLPNADRLNADKSNADKSNADKSNADRLNVGNLLDGDFATQPALANSRENVVGFNFSAGFMPKVIKLYIPEKTLNSFSLEYLSQSGIWVSFLGVGVLNGDQLRTGWNRIEVGSTCSVEQIRLRISKPDVTALAGIAEIEFWGQSGSGRPLREKTYPTEESQTLELQNGGLFHGAKQSVHITIDVPVYTIQKAKLVYEVANLASYKDGTWELNGQGEHSLIARGLHTEWTSVAEEIDPSLLIEGKNILNLKISSDKKNALQIRNVALQLSFATGEQEIAWVEGTGSKDELLPNLIDGDADTCWQTGWRVHDQASFILHLAGKTSIESVNWLQGKAFVDGVRVEYLSSTGWQILGHELVANDLLEGWNTLEASTTIETDQIRFTLLNPRGQQMIGPVREVSVLGSTAATYRTKSPILISYPTQGEIVPEIFPLKAHLKGNIDRVIVNGQTIKTPNKYFEKEIRVGELPGDKSGRTITVEAYQGNDLISTQSVIITPITGPTLTITAPTNGSYTKDAQITVRGETDSLENVLALNGRTFTTTSTAFSVPCALEEGINKITVSATNESTGSTTKTIYVHRDSYAPVIHLDEGVRIGVTSGQQTYRITGYVEEYSSCKLYVNNIEVPLQYGAFEYVALIVTGQNNFQFRAVDQLNQESTVQVCIVADPTEPDPFALSVTPGGWVASPGSTQVSFAASDNQSGISFYEAKIDDGSFMQVTNPYHLPPLTSGVHTIYIRAINGAGLGRVATVQISVDADRPNLFTPVISPAGWSRTKSPVVTFTTTDQTSGIHHFEVKVDAGVYVTAQSPYTLPVLTDGSHTITVKAVDNAGLDTTASAQALVDTVAPVAFTPTTQPAGTSNNNQPVISFQTTDASSGIDYYEVQIDSGSFLRVVSPYTPPVLSEGVHQITVKAYDKAGLSTTGMVQVSVDTVAPGTPANFRVKTGPTSVGINWSAGNESDLAKYRLYRNPAWATGEMQELNAPATLWYSDSQVVKGEEYTYYLVAVDRLGNESRPTEIITVTAGIAQETINPVIGGSVQYGNQVQIDVPNGATQETVTFTVDVASATEVPTTQKMIVVSRDTYKFALRSTNTVNGGSTGDPALDPVEDPASGTVEDPVFNTELTVTLGYDKSKIPAEYCEQDLDVYYYNDADGLWVRMPKEKMDLLQQNITFKTNHFSMYNIQVTTNYSPSASEYKDLGLAPYGSYFQSNEEFVAPGSGSLTIKANDLNLPGRNGFDLLLGRTYSSSQAIWDKTSDDPRDFYADFGHGWRLNIPRIEANSEGQYLYLEDGTAIKFSWVRGQDHNSIRYNTFEYHEGTHFSANKTQEKSGLFWNDKAYTVYFKDGTRYEFDAAGKIQQKVDRTGKSTITYGYDAATGRLISITDNTTPKNVTIEYTGATSKTIKSIYVNGVQFVSYSYLYDSGQLSSVTYRNMETTSYKYTDYDYKWGSIITYSATRYYANGNWEDYPTQQGNIEERIVPLLTTVVYPTKGVSKYEYYKGSVQTSSFAVTGSGVDENGMEYHDEGGGEVQNAVYNLRVQNHAQYLSTSDTVAQNPASYEYGEGQAHNRQYISSATITNKYQKVTMYYDSNGLNTSRFTYDLTNPNVWLFAVKESYAYNSNKEIVEKAVYHGGKSQPSFYEKYDYDNWGNLVHKYNSVNNADYYYHYLNTDSKPITGLSYLGYDQTQGTVNGNIHNLLADEFFVNVDSVNGKVTPEQMHYQYDGDGNVTVKAKRHGSTWVKTLYQYDPVWKANLIKETDPLGGVTNLVYDATNTFVVKISRDARVNADGAVSQLIEMQTEYDPLLGLKKWEMDPTLAKTEYEYDKLGRLTLVKYPEDSDTPENNLVKLQIYDDVRNVVTVANLTLDGTTREQAIMAINGIDPDLQAGGVIPEGIGNYRIHSLIRYVYDGLNRLVEIRQYLRDSERQMVSGEKLASPYVTRFGYDEVGNRITETDAEGRTTSKKYDGLGRLTDVLYPTDNASEYHLQIVYGVDINKRTIIDPDGYWTEEISDWNGNVIEVAKYEGQGAATANQLDLGRRFVSKASYDMAGNQVEIVDGEKHSFRSVYDDWNQLVESMLPEAEVIVSGSSSISLLAPKISYEYDNLGRKVAETAPDGNATATLNDYRVEYVYDYANRLIKTVVKRAEGDLTTKNYYDAASRLLKTVSPESQTSRKIYNARGLVVAEIDPEGNITGHTYNALGKETGLTNPYGVKTQTEGLTKWTVVRIDQVPYYLDAAYTATMAYDSLSRMIESKDLAGTTLNIFYDQVGAKRAEKVTAGPGQTGTRLTTYDYTPQYWLKSVTNGDVNGLNYKVEYEYDKRGNKVKEIYPSIQINGQATERIYQYLYDSLGRMTTMIKPEKDTNGENVKEIYGYDAIGNRIAVTNGRNYTTTYQYNGLGKLSEVTEPNGAVTKYYYDPNGNLVRKISANNLTTEYKYNTLSLLTEEVRARNGQTNQPATSYKFAYDNVGRIKATADPLGIVTAFRYYPNGNVAEKISYIPGSANASASLQQVMVSATPVGYIADEHISYVYDKLGNLTNVADSLGTESFIYDKLNRVETQTRVIDGKSYTTGYTYDFVGNLKSIQYPQFADSQTTGTQTASTQVVTYDYDSLNRLISVGGFADSLKDDPVKKNFMYDAAGNLTQMKYNNNTVTTITPDIMNRPQEITVQVPDAGTMLKVALNLSYKYDANGNVTSRNRNTYIYDELDRLSTAEVDGSMYVNTPATAGYIGEDYLVKNPINYEGEDVRLLFDYAGSTLGLRFDAVRRVSRVQLFTTGRADHRITAQGIRVFASSGVGGAFSEIPAKDWTFSKDAATGEILIVFKVPVTAYELKIHANYDDRETATGAIKDESQFVNWVRSMARVYTQTDRTRIHYDYDLTGNRTAETLTDLASNYNVTYSYNYYPGSDRLLTRESQTVGNSKPIEGYIDGILTYGPSDRKAYNYDNAGNLVEKGNTYTLAGLNNPAILPVGNGVGYWKYQYDSQNRLSAVWKNGTDNAHLVAKYGYDSEGKRLKTVENNKIIHTIYDYSGHAVFEAEYHVDSGDVYTAKGDALKFDKASTYVYALGHQLAKVENDMSTRTKYYYHYDNLGSVMMMTKEGSGITSDNSVVFKQDYTPFGQDLFDSGALTAPQQQTDPNFKFTGRRNDSTGLYYYGARYYDPEIGRFITEDSYEGDLLTPLTQNRYLYVLDNPLRFIDPTGHRSEEMCYDEGISKEIVVKGQITSWNYLEYDSLLHVNSDVKELQNLLISLGYNIGEAGADGKFGKDTIAAVKQFQADYGVEKTGEVGPTTRKALLDAISGKSLKVLQPISVPGTNKKSNSASSQGNKLVSGVGSQVKFTHAEQYGKRDVIYYSDSYNERRTGGTWTWRNNNPGNLRYYSFAKNHGAIGKAGGFAVFPNYETGAKAQVDLLLHTYYNSTVSEIMNDYAPNDENDTETYIKFICNRVKVGRDTKISSMSKEQFDAFVKAIRQMEGYKVGKIY